MSSISSPGLGSGLNVDSIVTQLVALERRPITQLATQATKIQAKISSWGQLQGALSSVQTAAEKLANAATWSTRTATSSDESVVTTQITGTGTTGPLTIKPTQMAAAQSNASTGFTASTDSVGTGSLTIELGTWTGTSSFAPKSGSTAVTIDITAGEDSLAEVRDKINAADAGVQAAIVFDGTNQRLVMTSKTTGATNGFRITATDDDGTPTNNTGLSRLTYNPPGGSSQLAQNVEATDAIAWVNNLEVHSTTNTFDQAVEGASFTIKKTSTTNVSVDVSHDKAAMKAAIDQFVSAYNSLNAFVRSTTKVNESDPSASGTLQGDRTASGLTLTLRSLLRESGPSSSQFTQLTDIGLDVSREGTLSFNTTKLDAALAKPDELKKLFAGDSTDTTNLGVAKRLGDATEALLGVEGNVSVRTAALKASLDRNGKEQIRLEDRVAGVQKRLLAQYSALDTRMASLNSLSSYISQQITTWNKKTG